MTPELKSLWIAALRSGKYEQTKSVLRDERNGFCCLGVLCDLVEPENWSKSKTPNWPYWNFATTENGDPCYVNAFPSAEFLRRVGLNSAIAESLASRNDRGESFEDIATCIEARVT